MPGGGGGGDKAVRLSFVVDEASLAQARSAIDGLISKAADLARVLSSTHIGGGPTAAPGGGGGMSLLSGGAVGGTSTSAQQLIQSAKPIQVGGLSAQLSQGLVAQKQLLTDLARGSSDAMRAMTDALGRAIDEEKRKLEGLQSTLKDTVDAYNATSESAKTFNKNANPETMSKTLAFRQQQMTEAATAETGSRSRLKELQQYQRELTGPEGGDEDGGGGGGGSRWNRFKSYMGKRRTLGAQGGLLSSAVEAAPLAVAATAGATFLKGRYLEEPLLQGSLAADRANVFAPMYQRGLSGDITDVLAQRGISQGQEGEDTAGLTSTGATWTRAGSNFLRHPLDSFVTAKGMSNTVPGGVGFETQKMQDWARQSENYKQAHFQEMMAAQLFTGGATSNIAMARQLGIGWKKNKDGSYNTGEAGGGVLSFQNKLLASGYDMGQYAGAFSQIQGTAGRKEAQSGGLAWQAMAAQATGMGNAATVAGQAALGGQGKQFMGEVYGAGYGRGGDATAAGALGGVIGSGIGSSGIYGSGLGALGAFNFFGAGASGTDQMRNVAFAQAGLGVMGSVSSGQFDPYQRGLNYVNAKKAGVGSVAGSDFLATLKDPKLLMDAMRGKGETFDEATALGIDKDQLRKYAQATIMSPLSRVFTGAFRDKSGHLSAAGSTAESLQLAVGKGESGQQWLLEQERGARVKHGTKAGHAFEMKKVTELGAALSESMGIDAAAGKGLAESMLGMGASGKKGGPGGVDDPALKAAAAKAKAMEGLIQTLKDNVGEFINASGQLPDYVKGWATSASNLGASANDIIAKFSKLGQATEELIYLMQGGSKTDLQIYRNKFHQRSGGAPDAANVKGQLALHPGDAKAIEIAAAEEGYKGS